MAKSNKRPIAVLNILKLRKIGDFIAKMRGISLNMANNVAIFTTPNPDLATFDANIDALEAAEAATETRTRGSVQARDQAYDLMLDNVHSELNYVQDLADAAADVDDALEVIALSGFDLKNHGVRVKPDFEAKNTELSGTVELAAKALGPRTAYEWFMSTDQTTWTELPTTMQAKTTVSGLTPGSIVYFKERGVTKEGEGNWSQIVVILVT